MSPVVIQLKVMCFFPVIRILVFNLLPTGKFPNAKNIPLKVFSLTATFRRAFSTDPAHRSEKLYQRPSTAAECKIARGYGVMEMSESLAT